MPARPSRLQRVATSLLLLLVLISLVFVIYFQITAYPALPETAACWIDNPQARIERDRISFLPPEGSATTGVIIYPGGNVDFHAYAPLAGRISASRYPVFVQRMPLNLAVFGIQRGTRIMDDYPDIEHWLLVGHSLGGAMAARLSLQHTDRVQGLVLLAAYPDVDLSQSGLFVISLYGSQDGVLNMERLEASLPLLPAQAEVTRIPGANHAGFGHYGPQKGDQEPLITREEQQNITAQAVLALLDTLTHESGTKTQP